MTPTIAEAARRPLTLRERITGSMSAVDARSFGAGIAAVLVLGGGSLYFSKGATSAQAQTSLVTVQRRTIVSGVKATGKVTFASEQQLKFNQRGTVTRVNFKEGDRVKEGQVIAELDKSSVLADIRSAQLSAGASALQLQQLQSDKQKTVDDAANALKVSQQQLPADLAAAQRAVDEKKASLDQAKLDLEKTQSTELQSRAQTAQDALASSEKLLDSLYSSLTRNQDSRPPLGTYDLTIDHFLYNDPNAEFAVEDAYVNALNADSRMHDKYGTTLGAQRDPAILSSALADADTFAKAIADLGEKTYSMLQGATTDTTRFTSDQLNTLRTTVSTSRTTASALVGTIETAQANLAALGSDQGVPSVTLQAKEDAVTTAENAYTLAQDNLKVMQTQNPGDLQSKQQAFDSAVTGTDINIKLKQNDLAQKAASISKTSQALKDYQLTAPFDGIITHIDYKVRDNLLDTGDTEYLVIQNPDFIVVTIPLDQVDVVRVKKDMKADILFDALPGQTFAGTIDQIDPTPIVQSGVVSYDVLIKLPTPKDLTILSGMTATVNIETAKKENVLAVPNLALRSVNGEMTVQRQGGRPVTVQTGATDGRYTEIVSGLNEGDMVLSMNIAAASSSVNANAAQQLFRLGGGGGGFGGGPAAGGNTRAGGTTGR